MPYVEVVFLSGPAGAREPDPEDELFIEECNKLMIEVRVCLHTYIRPPHLAAMNPQRFKPWTLLFPVLHVGKAKV